MLNIFENENGQIIRDLETRSLKWIRSELNLPQFLANEDMGSIGGATETFSGELLSEDELIKNIQIFAKDLGL